MKLFDNLSAQRALDPDVRTGVATGEKVVDSQGYRDGMLVGITGDMSCTTGNSYTLTVMECDTSTGSFTSTGISVVFSGANDAAASNQTKVARIAELNVTRKRFLRVDLTCTATTTSFEGTGIIILGESYAGPVNSD
ncbi:MAG: hypothetical protein DU489_07075 [Nitrosomonas sp.]|uniref:hypothetical protein n=1 Tax=Nitrosomonas sp. TaxID=42353 RepID=UPI0032F005F7